MSRRCALAVLVWLSIWACNTPTLPYYGEPERVTAPNGKVIENYPVIPPFRLINQYGKPVNERSVTGSIYVADFFFVTCPTICPVMKRNLKTVYDAFRNAPDVRFLSHTIDPEHDTPAVLKQYADDLGLTGTQWQFVTGNRETIYELGEKHYLVTAGQDSTAPGGYIHSGHFVLLDKERHIRGLYDGTTPGGTNKLIADVKRLRKQYE